MSSQSGSRNNDNESGARGSSDRSPPQSRNQSKRGGGGGGGNNHHHHHQRGGGQNQGGGGARNHQTPHHSYHNHQNQHQKRPGSGGKQSESGELEKATSSRRRKLTSLSSVTSGGGGGLGTSCICCLHDLNTYVYYQCGHFVCLNCAVKMRVLCSKLDCPVCRQESKSVVCTKRHMGEDQANKMRIEQLIRSGTRAPDFNQDLGQGAGAAAAAAAVPQEIVNVGIYFEREDNDDHHAQIRDEYVDILAHKCDICTENGGSSSSTDATFTSFRELDLHMRRVHKRFFCELCLQNLKLFPYERKHYTREELALHKRNGDKDDYSFKGHPLCEHCDERFFDRDELYRHYRKEHYYCHFCDTDGYEEYYRDYKQLRLHFLKYHHLCELDNCSANAAETHEYVVFRSELDFQAHKKQKHAKTKSEARAFSKINIEFNQSNDDNNRHRRPQGGGAGRGAGRGSDTRHYNNNNHQQHHRHHDSNEEEYDEPPLPPPPNRPHNNNNNNSNNNNNTNNRRGNNNQRQANDDPTLIRASREQSERDEDQRRRRTEADRLKEQYEKYNEQQERQHPTTTATTPATSGLSDIAAAISSQRFETAEAAVVNQSAANASNANTTWRDLIGSGSAPSINQHAEFPSLAALGAAIETTSNAAASSTSRSLFPFATNNTGSNNNKKSVWDKKSTLVDEENHDQMFSAKSNKKKKNKQKSDQVVGSSLDEAVVQKIEPVVNEQVKLSSKTSETTTPLVTITSPPPGFDKPPPGFEPVNKKLPPATKSDTPAASTTTTTKPSSASSSSTAAAATATQQKYHQPDGFDKRNQDLRTNLFSLFGHYNEHEFDMFKSLSHRFRSGDLSARDYLTHCEKLLNISDSASGTKNRKQEIKTTRSKFYDLVQEMIVLLPDLEKQHELYEAYVSLGGNNQKLRSSSPISLSAWGSASGGSSSAAAGAPALVRCEFCTQYLTGNEVNFHNMSHHGKQLNMTQNTPVKKGGEKKTVPTKQSEDFPSLISTSSSASASSRSPLNWASSKKTPETLTDPAAVVVTEKQQTKKKTNTTNSQSSPSVVEEFPPLSTVQAPSLENRFSAMPSASIFSNPSSHLSLVNKKKHRLQK